jgi:hypothetical protein
MLTATHATSDMSQSAINLERRECKDRTHFAASARKCSPNRDQLRTDHDAGRRGQGQRLTRSIVLHLEFPPSKVWALSRTGIGKAVRDLCPKIPPGCLKQPASVGPRTRIVAELPWFDTTTR